MLYEFNMNPRVAVSRVCKAFINLLLKRIINDKYNINKLIIRSKSDYAFS